MLKNTENFKKVYIVTGRTDLRSGIDGFAMQIQSTYEMDPFEENVLYLFCGRSAAKIKGIVWEGDGFAEVIKRIEKGRFQWPRDKQEVMELTTEQYHQLMDGYTVVPTIAPMAGKYEY